jgi:hypothetical protein
MPPTRWSSASASSCPVAAPEIFISTVMSPTDIGVPVDLFHGLGPFHLFLRNNGDAKPLGDSLDELGTDSGIGPFFIKILEGRPGNVHTRARLLIGEKSTLLCC